MSSFHDLAVEEALRSELGRTADFAPYGNEHRTPMTFVLDEVERQIGPRFTVYWADGGPPEVFCLTDFSPSPVVFSTRYLSLTAFIRHLMVDAPLKNVLVDVSERTALKVMAEMALRHGDPDYAALAFVKSLVGKGIWLDEYDQIATLELEPIREGYMATWFYGLLHELGHLNPRQFPEMFSDQLMLQAIDAALANFPTYTKEIKQEVIERATQRRSNSVIGLDQLRSEGLADIFAASVLFKTTFELMREINQQEFRIHQFVGEITIFLNIIAIIDRCRRIASIASTTTTDRDIVFEILLHPVSVTVRGLMQRQYLDLAITKFAYGDEYRPEEFQKVVEMINEVNEHFGETIDLVDSGVARAMEFSLFPERRENEWTLLEALRTQDHVKSAMATMEARRFLELVDTLGVKSKMLQALKAIVEDPGKPVVPNPTGDLVYFVPWIEGPDGFNRPFGLDTKYGHMVFVFREPGELYESFFETSARNLKPAFSLKKAIVPVARAERLGPELAALMPSGLHFQVIVEGTEEFRKYMAELADDTIFDDVS